MIESTSLLLQLHKSASGWMERQLGGGSLVEERGAKHVNGTELGEGQ